MIGRLRVLFILESLGELTSCLFVGLVLDFLLSSSDERIQSSSVNFFHFDENMEVGVKNTLKNNDILVV